MIKIEFEQDNECRDAKIKRQPKEIENLKGKNQTKRERACERASEPESGKRHILKDLLIAHYRVFNLVIFYACTLNFSAFCWRASSYRFHLERLL